MQLSTTARSRSNLSGDFLRMAVAALAILLAISTAALAQLSGPLVPSIQSITALVVALVGALVLNSDSSPLRQPRG